MTPFSESSPQVKLSSSRLHSLKKAKQTAPFKYNVQCSVCGKKFKRNKQSTQLNSHKGKNGLKCYGRVGYRV